MVTEARLQRIVIHWAHQCKMLFSLGEERPRNNNAFPIYRTGYLGIFGVSFSFLFSRIIPAKIEVQTLRQSSEPCCELGLLALGCTSHYFTT